MQEDISAFTGEISALITQNEKLKADDKVAVRQAKATVKIEYEKKVMPLNAKIQTHKGQKRKLDVVIDDGKMETEIPKADNQVIELKLRKSNWTADAEDMEIMRAENKVL